MVKVMSFALGSIKPQAKTPSSSNFLSNLTSDPSVFLLILSNLIAIFFAVVEGWALPEVFFLYWCQSVMIGFFQFLKILSLKDFSVEGFSINHRPTVKSKGTQLFTAGFFAFHYGSFHFGYLLFIMAAFSLPALLSKGALFFVIVIAAFFFNHLFSYNYFKDKPFKSPPNIGMLMFQPYARIVPMHLFIVFGIFLSAGTETVVLFLLLKTVADVVMHVVEHSKQMGN